MEIKNHSLYRYDKGSGWCKHGIVYTYKKGDMLFAIDTYWDSEFGAIKTGYIGDYSIYEAGHIKNDLVFVSEIDNLKEVKEDEFYLYDEKDRILIPMGSWSPRFLVKKDAKIREDYIVEDLKYKIKNAESKIWILERNIEKWERELTDIKTI